MKRFNTTQEILDSKNLEIFEEVVLLCSYAADSRIDLFMNIVRDFSTYLGDNVVLIEDVNELKEIKFFDKSIFEDFVDFDQAFYLKNREYMLFFKAINDAGGDVIFVPIELETPELAKRIFEVNRVKDFRFSFGDLLDADKKAKYTLRDNQREGA